MNETQLSAEILEHLAAGKPELGTLDAPPNATLLDVLIGMERSVRDKLITERVYERGDILCREGEAGNAMYLIRSGRTVVFKGDPQAPTILGYRGPGEVIGEMTVLENRPRSATLAALDNLRVLEISRERFQEMLAHHPTVGLHIMTHLSARLREADTVRTVKTQASQSLNQRLGELEDREQHLLELQRVRQETSNLIVHDLRNPLGIIYGALQLFELTLPETVMADNRELMDMATVACNRMLRMVNSLLDAARLESGEAQLHLSSFYPHRMLDNLLTQFRPVLQSADITLDNRVPDDLPYITADLDKIERVVSNLVDNAIKHLDIGGRLTLAAEIEAQPSGAYLRVSVTDTGPGIPPSERERIFERFAQVEGDKAKRQGFGLGLSFCKLAVEAHGGRIWVESGPGDVGSRFIFTLPVNGPETEAA